MQKLSDEEILRLCKSQNVKAQMEIYRRYSVYLYTISYRIVQDKMLAEDIMQEVFIKLFNSLTKIKQPQRISYWLKRITINRSIDEWKRNKKINWEDLDDIPELIEDKPHPTEQSYEQLIERINDLPEKYRMVVELYYLQEYNHEEISEELNMSPGHSRVLLNRAKEKLKNGYKENIIR